MKRSPADIRAQLGHPVIDCDGHWLEPIPVFLEYLRDLGGYSYLAMQCRTTNQGVVGSNPAGRAKFRLHHHGLKPTLLRAVLRAFR